MITARDLKPWQTWVFHAAVAVLVTVVAYRWFPAWEAARYATWGYVFLQLDQWTRKLSKGSFSWALLDPFLDMIAPAASAHATAFLLLRFFS